MSTPPSPPTHGVTHWICQLLLLMACAPSLQPCHLCSLRSGAFTACPQLYMVGLVGLARNPCKLCHCCGVFIQVLAFFADEQSAQSYRSWCRTDSDRATCEISTVSASAAGSWTGRVLRAPASSAASSLSMAPVRPKKSRRRPALRIHVAVRVRGVERRPRRAPT